MNIPLMNIPLTKKGRTTFRNQQLQILKQLKQNLRMLKAGWKSALLPTGASDWIRLLRIWTYSWG